MKRRAFVAGFGAVVAAPHATRGQQAGRIYKIGYISPAIMPRTFSPTVRDAFNQGLAEVGLVLGQNIVEEGRGRGAAGHPERLPELANELVKLNVDVIIGIASSAVLAARQATRTIPIGMAYVHDPEPDGLIASLARPGGNVTGLATLGSELGQKILQLTKEVMPHASRLVLIIDRDSATSRRLVNSWQDTAKLLGLILLPVEVRDVDDFERSLDAIRARRPDAVWVTSTAIARNPRTLRLTVRNKWPGIYGSRRAVEDGALFSYNENDALLWRRVARYVGTILRGANPADLPVEQPPFELSVNVKTAKAFGLTIPPSLLLRADQVIE